jgi:hypothetical protein
LADAKDIVDFGNAYRAGAISMGVTKEEDVSTGLVDVRGNWGDAGHVWSSQLG